MEKWLELAARIGFPSAVALYLLIRLDHVLSELTKATATLAAALATHDATTRVLIDLMQRSVR